MRIISEEETHRVLAAALSPGDDVLIHASLSALGTFEPGPEAIIDALFAAVGQAGTVIMMTATRSFAKTGRFSVDQPSETGLLTEKFRQRPGVRRSVVPMVSFAAAGARASEYLQAYHSHLDSSAPMTRLLENDGKILMFGLSYNYCTLYHLSEERHASAYNFYKTFEGYLVEADREIAAISQRYFVRKDMSVAKNCSIAGQMLEQRGQVTMHTLGNGMVRACRARDFDACCMEALATDPDAFLDKSPVLQEPL